MPNMPLIKKASGEFQKFSAQKLEISLRRAGADDPLIQEIVKDVQSWLSEGMSTRNIYSRAFLLLRRKRRSVAARYSLKNAIMQLGPTGFPFELFIGQVFKQQGFDVLVGQEVQGMCVTHEVDVIATANGVQRLVECKYYNSPDKFATVQVPLYIRSRVNDIVNKRKSMSEFQNLAFEGWIVTNTRFSSDALLFGTCSGLNLMSWNHPLNNSLKDLVEQYGVFPVTALTQLTKVEKQALIDKRIVHCRQLLENPEKMDFLELKVSKRRLVMEEINDLCNS
jgi:hypothetical protein